MYEVDHRILKCDYIGHSPAESSITNAPVSQENINIPRENSVISLLNSYSHSSFKVITKTDKSRNANGNDIRLVNMDPIVLFGNDMLTTGSGKHLQVISQAQIISLMYKLKTSARDSDDLSIGFGRDRGRRQQESTENKNLNCRYHVRIMLKDVFGFAEYQEN